MYDDDDPYLAELREVCLALPESAEVEAWGRPTFRAGKELFAVFGGNDDHPFAVTFKPDAEERRALIEDPRFYVPNYFGVGGWLALDFTVAPVEWDEVTELMDTSYRQVAPQTDGEGARRPSFAVSLDAVVSISFIARLIQIDAAMRTYAIPAPNSVARSPTNSTRTPPSRTPSGMAIHANAPVSPRTRPRMCCGTRSNSTV